MPQEAFSGKQVKQAIRKFEGHAQDALNAVHQTYGDSLTRLVQFLETDPVMAVVVSPLKQNPHVDIDAWYQSFQKTGGSMVGSKRYELPQDEDDRLALIYQFLLRIVDENSDIHLWDFCVDAYGGTQLQSLMGSFNTQLLQPFLRDFFARLEEDIDVSRDQEVAPEQLGIFQNYGVIVGGNAQGSNIATGQAQITSSTASFETSEELASELRKLREFLSEVPKEDRASTESAINTLIGAAEGQPTARSALVSSVETVSAQSPTMRQHLESLVVATSASLASHGVIQAISFALGV